MKPLYLVDGSAYLFRAYHALPPLTRSDGLPVSAVRGFTAMILRLQESQHEAELVVIFDAPGPTFRHQIYPDYKANRDAPPEDLIPQFPLVREATRALGLPCIEAPGYEADDLIATYTRLARTTGREVVIVSSDKDLMQLVGPGVTMLDPIKQARMDEAAVYDKFGVAPSKVVEVQALAGDASDNVPGVPGIGVKTAAQLLSEYDDLDSLLAKAEQIKQPKRRQNLIDFAEQARLSRRLVQLDAAVPDLPALTSLKTRRDDATLAAFLHKMEFRQLRGRLGLEAPTDSPGTLAPPAEIRADYQLIDRLEQLDALIAEARAAHRLALDVETTSLDAQQAEIVGIALAVTPGQAFYLPLSHVFGQQLDSAAVFARLAPLLSASSVLKIGHNLKYDLSVLRRAGLEVKPYDDTLLLSFVLDGGKFNHGLDELARRHFGQNLISFKEVAGSGKNQLTFDQVPLEAARDYAAEDADYSLRLWQLLKPRLAREGLTRVYERIERPMPALVSEMEQAGIRIDGARLARMSQDFAVQIHALEREIHALAGEAFTIGSPKQLGEILFGKMGLTARKKSGKTGAYSTDSEVLEELAAEGQDLPAKVLEWRTLAKLKSTYSDALQTQINPRTGRVHTSFVLTGAQTGRLSSTDPNVQNIPVRTEVGAAIREAFIAEPGHKLISADYSQIELRLTAHMAEEAALRQAFHDGIDIHALTASQVFGVPIAGMDPLVRRQAKAINFGIIYGISAFGLARNLRIPRAEAAAFIEAYFKRFPGIRHYMEAAKTQGREQGYVETLFGRRIHLPGFADKKPSVRSFAERQAINAPIQGTAADIIKRAMARLPAQLADLPATMLLQVHDELIFEVADAAVEEASARIKAVMEAACAPVVTLSVPLVVDVGQGENWRAAH